MIFYKVLYYKTKTYKTLLSILKLTFLVLIAAKNSSKVNFRIVFTTNYHHSPNKILKRHKHKKHYGFNRLIADNIRFGDLRADVYP